MAAVELQGSPRIRETTKGVEGTRIFKAPYSSWQSDCPKAGSAFPGYPRLKLQEREMEPLTPDRGGTNPAGLVRVTCIYTTAQWIDTTPQWSGEVTADVLETGYGNYWQGTGRRSQQCVPVVFPLEEKTLTYTTLQLPEAASILCAGRINAFDFMGYPPERLLYNGMTWSNRYDWDRGVYMFTVSLRFTARPMSWEMAWRAPEQVRIDGALAYAENGEPVFVDGPAGAGGWDRHVIPIYEQADFNPLIGKRRRVM